MGPETPILAMTVFFFFRRRGRRRRRKVYSELMQ
jgi:hypothetical protein